MDNNNSNTLTHFIAALLSLLLGYGAARLNIPVQVVPTAAALSQVN